MPLHSIVFTKMKRLHHLTVVVFKDCLSDLRAKIGLVMTEVERDAGFPLAPSGGIWGHGTTALL